MAIEHMTEVWEYSKAGGAELVVLLAIANNCDERRESWTSIGTLARRARISERSVQRILKNLEEMGEIEIRHITGPFGCNTYRLCDLKGGVTNCHRGCQSVTGGDKLSPGGDRLSPPPNGTAHERGGDNLSPGGDNLSPEPVGWLVGSFLEPEPEEPTNQPTEEGSGEEDESARIFDLLTDPEVGVSEPRARVLAETLTFDYVLRSVAVWYAQMHAGEVRSPGALANRLAKQWRVGPLPEIFKSTDLYRRHAPPEDDEADLRRRYIPVQFQEIIIG